MPGHENEHELWGSRGRSVSISILGNGHPEKFIPMDRGSLGSRAAATKEQFLICLDHSTARHAALPSNMQLPEGVSPWTWLPWLPQQAKTFGWEALFDAPDAAEAKPLEADDSQDAVDDDGKPSNCLGPAGGYILHFPDGNETRLRYILTAQVLRTKFRISSRWRMADPTDHIRAAARKVTKHFSSCLMSFCPLRIRRGRFCWGIR